jgi:hypothetical protein
VQAEVSLNQLPTLSPATVAAVRVTDNSALRNPLNYPNYWENGHTSAKKARVLQRSRKNSSWTVRERRRNQRTALEVMCERDGKRHSPSGNASTRASGYCWRTRFIEDRKLA